MALPRKCVSQIHVAKARLRLSEEDYRALLVRVTGKTSSADFDAHDFEAVMDEFHRLGFRSDWRERTYGHRLGMATPAQLELIRKLWSEYHDGKGDEAGLGRWLEHKFKVSSPRFVTLGIARKVIAALKAMVQRKRDKGAA
jgi:hypothetical protein